MSEKKRSFIDDLRAGYVAGKENYLKERAAEIAAKTEATHSVHNPNAEPEKGEQTSQIGSGKNRIFFLAACGGFCYLTFKVMAWISSFTSPSSASPPALISPSVISLPTPNQSRNNLPKLDNLLLAMKYQSNPFDIRAKALSRPIETSMFQEKFIDEGVNARIIDANSGFFCLMRGSDYASSNKRGLIVVNGILGEYAGKIGLNDCKFISYDPSNTWKATDDYEKFINSSGINASNRSSVQATNVPSRASGNYEAFCREDNTKRGILDTGQYQYCLGLNNEGYDKLEEIAFKYSSTVWIKAAIDYSVAEWTKNGSRQDRMVAYALGRIIDGFENLVYESKQPSFSQKRYEACYGKWSIRFEMVDYCYKGK